MAISWKGPTGVTAALLFGALAAPAAETVSYDKQVRPLLADRCYSCHGPDKQKGELRLDSPAAIRKGGKHGDVLVAGNLAKSPLYARTLLAADDSDVMPAKGDPLTAAQCEVLRQWIVDGAKFDGVATEVATATLPGAPGAPAKAAAPVTTALDVVAAGVSAPDAAAVSALTAKGVVVKPVAKGTLLDVTCAHLTEPFGDAQVQMLQRIAANIAWLDLRGTAVSDAQLTAIGAFPHLTRLHLERTAIGDAGVAHLSGSTHLEYLNLYGTKVTDAGLAGLAKLPALRSVFVWQTAATPAGIAGLRKAAPQVAVDAGQ
jgi:mono/diheme cytochrome c family protein